MNLFSLAEVAGTSPTFDIDSITSGISATLAPFIENLSVANIAKVLALVILSALTLYLFYWGSRKGLSMLKGAFSKGKLRI